MVRIATVNDAEQLNILNNEFNGEGASIDNIGNSLVSNKQEVVIVADEDDILVGFVCVQLKKSFCYDEYMPEITEVYVKPTYRNRGIASEMIIFAENYCSKNYPLHKYELLTGQENLVAQSVYNKLGYVDDNELHLSKRVKRQSNSNLQGTENFRLPVCLKVTGDLKFSEVKVNIIEANKRTQDVIRTQKVHRKISTHC